MIFLILFVILISVIFWCNRTPSGNNLNNKQLCDIIEVRKEIKQVCFTVLSFLLFIFIIIFSINYYEQIEDIEEVKMYDINKNIYTSKYETINKEIVYYLSTKYPNHEKEIFKSMNSGELKLYFVKYPELKASKTLMELVDNIVKLKNDIYDQELYREMAKKRIRVRIRNPWLLKIFIPNIPNNKISEMTYE